MTRIACLMAAALLGLACSSTSPGTSPRADASDDTLGTADQRRWPTSPIAGSFSARAHQATFSLCASQLA